MAFLNNKFWQVYFLKQSEKLKFYEVLILGFIRFYSLLKQSAKLTFTNSMTAQNCVHLHARVVVPKHEFSIVDQRKIALVNELRNFRTVTSKVSSFKYSIPLQLNDGSEKHSKPLYHQAIIKKTHAHARDGRKCGLGLKVPISLRFWKLSFNYNYL